MNELRNCDSMLKRFLKRKVKVTDALVVTFLITGGFAFAAPPIPTQESLGIPQVIEQLEEVEFWGWEAQSGNPEIPNVEADFDYTDAGITSNNTAEGPGNNNFNVNANYDIAEMKSGGIGAGGYQLSGNNNSYDWFPQSFTYSGTMSGTGFGMLADGSLSNFDHSDYNFSEDVEISNEYVPSVNNNGTIATTGDVGVGAINGAYGENNGFVVNDGNYGMYASGYSGTNTYDIGDYTIVYDEQVLLSSSVRASYDVTIDNTFAGVENYGFIANSGDVGMYAGNGAYADNYGTIQNGIEGEENSGNYGMLADGGQSVYFDSYSWGEYSTETNVIAYLRSEAYNSGTISNFGEVGMGAINGAYAQNNGDGTISNLGDFGMAAFGGAYVYDTYWYELYPEYNNNGENFWDSEVYNYGTVANQGNFGMFANGGAYAVNDSYYDEEYYYGTIQNNGDFGMFATGAFWERVSEEVYYSEVENYGNINNIGNYGMVATEGAYAYNEGWVYNEGNFGMVAIGGKLIEFEDPNDDFVYYSGIYNDYDVYNDGDYGMVAFDGAYSINDEDVYNNGNFGMASIGGGVSLNTDWVGNYGDYGMIAISNPDDDVWSTVVNAYEIQNSEDYGMAAIDGAFAINMDAYNEYGSGWINNSGDVGMLLTGESVGYNSGYINPEGDIGVLLDGDATFMNFGYIEPGNGDIAIQAGNGNNTLYLGGGAEGTVNGGNGTNTLMYFSGTEFPPNVPLDAYGTVIDNTFSHLASLRWADEDNYGLYVDRNLELRMSQNTELTNYNKDANGRIDYTQFNGFEFTALTGDGPNFSGIDPDDYEFLGEIDGIIGKPVWKNESYNLEDLYYAVNGDEYPYTFQDIVIEEDSNLTLTLGQNRVSVIAANSISGDGTITQRTLDQFFTTDAQEIEVRNILVSDTPSVRNIDPIINFDVDIETENLADGWAVRYEQNDDGSISTIYYRTAGVSTNSLLGGYKESTQHYTQSNVDILNSNLIRDKGYGYARAFAFEKPEIITTTETVAKTNPKTVTKGKEVTPLPATTLETTTKTTEKMFKWTQFAELSGEGGKYDGSTNQNYDYSTFGVTGGTFTRLPEDWTAGLTYGYARSKVDYSSGKENLNSLGANLFATKKYNNWLGTVSAGYAWSRHDLDRSVFDRDSLVEVGIIGENHLSADFDSHIWNTGLEIGYDFPMKGEYNLYTYVGFDYSWYKRDGYTESGAGNLAMDLEKIDYGMPQSKLGAQFDAAIDKWDLTADLAWYHIFYDAEKDGKTYGNFKNMNSDSTWKIPGLNIGKDIGVLRLAADYEINQQMSVGVEYNGYVRDGEFGNRGALNFNYKW